MLGTGTSIVGPPGTPGGASVGGVSVGGVTTGTIAMAGGAERTGISGVGPYWIGAVNGSGLGSVGIDDSTVNFGGGSGVPNDGDGTRGARFASGGIILSVGAGGSTLNFGEGTFAIGSVAEAKRTVGAVLPVGPAVTGCVSFVRPVAGSG